MHDGSAHERGQRTSFLDVYLGDFAAFDLLNREPMEKNLLLSRRLKQKPHSLLSSYLCAPIELDGFYANYMKTKTNRSKDHVGYLRQSWHPVIAENADSHYWIFKNTYFAEILWVSTRNLNFDESLKVPHCCAWLKRLSLPVSNLLLRSSVSTNALQPVAMQPTSFMNMNGNYCADLYPKPIYKI